VNTAPAGKPDALNGASQCARVVELRAAQSVSKATTARTTARSQSSSSCGEPDPDYVANLGLAVRMAIGAGSGHSSSSSTARAGQAGPATISHLGTKWPTVTLHTYSPLPSVNALAATFTNVMAIESHLSFVSAVGILAL
jgi:hypothetical protein